MSYDKISSVLDYVQTHYAHGSPARVLAAEVERLRRHLLVWQTGYVTTANAAAAEISRLTAERDAAQARVRAFEEVATAFDRAYPPDHRIHPGSPAVRNLVAVLRASVR